MAKIVVLLVLLAVAVYLLVRVIERRGVAARPSQSPRRPLGPDDDDDFIWGLNKRKRHPKGPDED